MVAIDPVGLLNLMVAVQNNVTGNNTNSTSPPWNTNFRDHGGLAKAFHGVTLGLSVIVFVITLPLLILRRNYQPLKAFSFPIQTFQLFAMMITLNYLNVLVLVGVRRFPCWLDNILEYGLLYVYLCITVWRVIRIYSVFQAVFMKIKIPTAKSPSAKLNYQRAARFFEFFGSKFFFIFAGVLGIVHLVEIILAEVVIAAPWYDPKIPEQGCYYYAVGGGIEDLLSTVFALADVVGYAIVMIIFTVLLLALRIKDTYGVVLGIFFTWSHWIIGAIYFVSVRLIFALIPSTAVGAGNANFEVLNSTNIFAFGMVLDMIINITVPAIRTYFWKQASGDKGETAEGFDITSVGFFLPGSPNEEAVRIFKNYATKELSVENVIFFEYFNVYKATTPEGRKSMTNDIFSKFFSNDALFPLNVAATYATEVAEKVESVQTVAAVEDNSLFDEVAQAVQQNCFDTFIRFSKTTEYKAFVAKNASDVENAKTLKKIGWEYQQLKAVSAGTPTTQAGNGSPTSPGGSPSILGTPNGAVTPTTPQI